MRTDPSSQPLAVLTSHALPPAVPAEDDSAWGWECACPALQCDGWELTHTASIDPSGAAAATVS